MCEKSGPEARNANPDNNVDVLHFAVTPVCPEPDDIGKYLTESNGDGIDLKLLRCRLAADVFLAILRGDFSRAFLANDVKKNTRAFMSKRALLNLIS